MSIVCLPAFCRWLAVLGARAAVVWIVEAFFFLEGLGIEGRASPSTVHFARGSDVRLVGGKCRFVLRRTPLSPETEL